MRLVMKKQWIPGIRSFRDPLVYEEDPVKAWEEYEGLQEQGNTLNKEQFQLFITAPGTDLTLWLAEEPRLGICRGYQCPRR